MPEPRALLADAPVERVVDDGFRRAGLAGRIAAEAVHAPADAGFVISICGPWGSGKTSLANMVIEQLDPEQRQVAVRFNPWVFSGADDLIGRFFGEMMKRLGKEPGALKKVASTLGGYAGALSGPAKLLPTVGSAAEAILKGAERVASVVGEEMTLEEHRQAVLEALGEFDGRIVVFFDDIDRLTDSEIREMVRLVKLVGDLPRVTYVLAFDRARVEQALGSPEQDPDRATERGRAFLEKIVQSPHNVPPLRPTTLLEFMQQQINTAIEPYPQPPFHEHDYNNMVGLAFKYMVTTPRDAIRVANALPAAMELDSDEVCLTDLIGLEVLRILEPDVHAGLPGVGDILTEAPRSIGDTERVDAERRERLDTLIARGRHPEAVRALLGQLFPKAERALGNGRAFRDERSERLEQRVSEPSVFRAYIHRSVDEETVEAVEVSRLLSLFHQPDSLRDALAVLSPERRADAIGRLVDHKHDFNASYAVDVAAVVLSVSWDLPDEPVLLTGRVSGRVQTKWLVAWLLLSEKDEQARAALVEHLLERAPDISTRVRVLQWFGTYPENGARDQDAEMLDDARTTQLLDDLVERVDDAAPADLAREPILRWIFAAIVSHDEARGREIIGTKAQDDELMFALLRAHYGASSSVTLGEAAIRREIQLVWKDLVWLLGEEVLRKRITTLRDQLQSEDLDAEAKAALEYAVDITEGRKEPPSP
jgi:KAP family P-loop domain